MPTLAETISAATLQHFTQRRGLLFGQCLTAVGRVAGTIPDVPECTDPHASGGIVELPTSDVAGPGFVVGAALAGRRPVFVCRYQGFMAYNLATLANYAAKSMEMWNVPCPVFIRAIAMEGGIGPVATGSHHSAAMRYPGVRVMVPMTPGEWLNAWDSFLTNPWPVYCSEHRLAFKISEEMPDEHGDGIRFGRTVTLLGISAGRLSCREAALELRKLGYSVRTFGITHLKPLLLSYELMESVKVSDLTVVVDSDFATCGAAEHVVAALGGSAAGRMLAMGLEDRTAGFAPHLDNRTPSPAKIVGAVLQAIA